MIRPAKLADAQQAIPILMQIIHDMEIPVVKSVGEDKIQDLLIDAFAAPDYRYGYPQMLVYVDEQTDKVLGICVGYPAAKEANIDDGLRPYLANHGLPADFAMFSDVEAQPGEWYLDSFAVAPAYQNKGIGTKTMEHFIEVMRDRGEKILSLNVDVNNEPAKHVYTKTGFKKVGQLYIGSHLYDHMQYDLAK